MPGVNHVGIASAGVIAISVAIAAAIAVYESPELRRMAEDLRRRIAIALHSLGDNINPNDPIFNRPEDAEGFLRSRGVVPEAGAGAEPGVEADEETRRRQREELMYWNAVLLEKKEKERMRGAEEAAAQEKSQSPGSHFDDFLQEDNSAGHGTYVFNTGAEVRGDSEGLVRRRGAESGVRGLNASVYANPFADEHGIDLDEHQASDAALLSPGKDETMSDIYNATERDQPTAASRTLSPPPVREVLFDFSQADEPRPDANAQTTLERELSDDEFMTAGQDDRLDAYASIQAWAQNSNPGFYSPLPVSPAAPLSEPEVISQGALTPTYSASYAGSGEDIANDAASSKADHDARYYDVLSDDEDGVATPASWTEVGSVVSENDGAVHA